MATRAPDTRSKSGRRTDEDLFEHTRMSFGEHLEELRKVLVRALIGVAVGTAIGLYFGNSIIAVLLKPLNRSIEKFNQTRARQAIVDEAGWVPEEFEVWLQAGYIPQKIWVDPADLAESLPPEMQRSLPPAAPVTDHIGLTEFPREKMREACRRMASTKDAYVLPRAIFRQLSENDRARVTAWSDRDEELSDADAEAFLEILDRLLNDHELRQLAEFRSPDATVSWWQQALGETDDRNSGIKAMNQRLDRQADAVLNRKLNRVLLHRAFSDLLPPLKTNLVPLTTWREVKVSAQSLAITEPFMIWVKAGVIAGLFLASPWVFYQLWTFVAAGLYPHEQRYVHVFLPISLGLFLSGILLAYFFVFDPVLQFLFAFNAQTGIEPQPRVSEWLSFVLILPLGFGIAFQLPLLMLFLNRIGLIDVSTYLVHWRIAIMVIFILAMFLTPADPISMLLLAVPLTILYFGGVLMCLWKPASRSPFDDDVLANPS